MNDFIAWFLSLAQQFDEIGYLILALFAFLEAVPVIGFFVPGVLALIAAGFLVAEGSFDLGDALVIAALAGVLGDLTGFSIAKRFSHFLTGNSRFLKQEYLDRASSFSERFGTAGIFLSRFLGGPIRSVISLVAAVSGMSWLRFSILSALSSLIFTAGFIALGYFLNAAWQTAAEWSSRGSLVLGGLVMLIIALWWFKRFIIRQGKEVKAQLAQLFYRLFAATKPRLNNFWAARLDPGFFQGLPQTSLILAALGSLALAVTLAFALSDQVGFWVSLDERLLSGLRLFASATAGAGALLISLLGSSAFVMAAGTALTGWLFLERRRSHIVGLWTAVLGTTLCVSAIKFLAARPRPAPTLYFENFFSFPSMHAALGLALFAYLAYYGGRAYPRWSRNVSLAVAATFVIIIIGFSRLYLGVHYFSDILAGWLIAAAFLMAGIVIQRRLENVDEPLRWGRWPRLFLASGIAFILLGLYVVMAFDRGSIRELYSTMPRTSGEERRLEQIIAKGIWPVSTENLRGGRERPLGFIFEAPSSALVNSLKRIGWIERDQPRLDTVLERAGAFLIGVEYERAPMRPRFWLNEPNELTFTKEVERDEKTDIYVLRLWQVPVTGDPGIRYAAELSVDRDFSLDAPSREALLEDARRDLLLDLAMLPSFRGFETISPPLPAPLIYSIIVAP